MAAAPKRSWFKIFAGIVVAGILFIAGCTYLLVRAVSGPIDAANKFLADIDAQDFEAACEHFAPGCRTANEAPPDVLAGFFGDGVTSYNLTGGGVEAGGTGSASGTITLNGNDERTITLDMVSRNDEWLVCGFNVGARP